MCPVCVCTCVCLSIIVCVYVCGGYHFTFQSYVCVGARSQASASFLGHCPPSLWRQSLSVDLKLTDAPKLSACEHLKYVCFFFLALGL